MLGRQGHASSGEQGGHHPRISRRPRSRIEYVAILLLQVHQAICSTPVPFAVTPGSSIIVMVQFSDADMAFAEI